MPDTSSVESYSASTASPAPSDRRPTLIVFGRLPVPGQCKTRLIPALGPAGSASLYSRMLKRMLLEALSARLGDVVLMLTPSPQQAREDATLAPLLARLERDIAQVEQMACSSRPDAISPSRIRLEAQPQGELGERMQLATVRHLPSGPVLLMGSDIPALERQTLQRAARALQQQDTVLLPTEDGGYGLIGLNAPCPQAFALPHWSHCEVYAQTRSALLNAGRTIHSLPASWDIDEPEDLARLTRHYPELARAITN